MKIVALSEDQLRKLAALDSTAVGIEWLSKERVLFIEVLGISAASKTSDYIKALPGTTYGSDESAFDSSDIYTPREAQIAHRVVDLFEKLPHSPATINGNSLLALLKPHVLRYATLRPCTSIVCMVAPGMALRGQLWKR